MRNAMCLPQSKYEYLIELNMISLCSCTVSCSFTTKNFEKDMDQNTYFKRRLCTRNIFNILIKRHKFPLDK